MRGLKPYYLGPIYPYIVPIYLIYAPIILLKAPYYLGPWTLGEVRLTTTDEVEVSGLELIGSLI